MEFEYDDGKSQANEGKHGIDFVEAQALWLDENMVEVPARTDDDARFVVIGRIAESYWSAIITCRSDRIRLISVRRSRPEEVEIYES